jgi:hypothetical protein
LHVVIHYTRKKRVSSILDTRLQLFCQIDFFAKGINNHATNCHRK